MIEKIKKVKEARKLVRDIKKFSKLRDIRNIQIYSHKGSKEELRRLIREEGFSLKIWGDDDKMTWVRKEVKIPMGITCIDSVIIEVCCFLGDYGEMEWEKIREIREELKKVSEE